MSTSAVPIDLPWARNYVESHVDKRQVNKIQHAFPSPRFWSNREVPVDQVKENRNRLESVRDSAISLYMGVPFCIKTDPGKCGYCLFPVEDYTGNASMDDYLENYLKKEVEMMKSSLEGKNLWGVYFGGGTSNLYRPEKYQVLMDLVHELFPVISPQVDITLEGIPQLFSRDKLEAIRDSGMNRISMGVQQLNEDLNRLSGRKQTKKQVIRAIENSQELGLACNVDVIFGWPQQTLDSMVKDLEELVALGVRDITHYELNVGGPTDFALNRYHELPSTLTNLEMYRVSRDLLQSHGFEQVTAYNWRKAGEQEIKPYEEGVIRRFTSIDAVGFGYAAMTFFMDVELDRGQSWSYINWRNLDQYRRAIEEGRYPAECGYQHDPEDFRLFMLFRNLFALELDREAYHDAFGLDVFEEFSNVWTALEEFGLAEITEEKIALVGDGPFYTPMVQTMLAEERYRHLRSREVRGRGIGKPAV
ncbi:MAG: radical SAM protein [Planctomycetota bacterium]|nr:radical SAM protein [Planctomycetota bacterium]